MTYICSQRTTSHHAQKLIYHCVLTVWLAQTKIPVQLHNDTCIHSERFTCNWWHTCLRRKGSPVTDTSYDSVFTVFIFAKYKTIEAATIYWNIDIFIDNSLSPYDKSIVFSCISVKMLATGRLKYQDHILLSLVTLTNNTSQQTNQCKASNALV